MTIPDFEYPVICFESPPNRTDLMFTPGARTFMFVALDEEGLKEAIEAFYPENYHFWDEIGEYGWPYADIKVKAVNEDENNGLYLSYRNVFLLV